MKMLAQSETVLHGNRIMKGGTIVADDVSKRIEYLTQNILKHVSTSDDGWDKLYFDEADSRYWELIYLDSESHGGGTSTLQSISKDKVVKKYNI